MIQRTNPRLHGESDQGQEKSCSFCLPKFWAIEEPTRMGRMLTVNDSFTVLSKNPHTHGLNQKYNSAQFCAEVEPAHAGTEHQNGKFRCDKHGLNQGGNDL